MRFTVTWIPAAEENLADIWMRAADRQAVTSAAQTIDILLANDPQTRGNPRFDTVRMLTVPPLGVDFEVIEDDRLVYVLSAWETSTGTAGP
jgi:hypothetical protein